MALSRSGRQPFPSQFNIWLNTETEPIKPAQTVLSFAHPVIRKRPPFLTGAKKVAGIEQVDALHELGALIRRYQDIGPIVRAFIAVILRS